MPPFKQESVSQTTPENSKETPEQIKERVSKGILSGKKA